MRFIKLLFSRATIISLVIILQVAAFTMLFLDIHKFNWTYSLVLLLLELIVYIRIINKKMNPSQQVLWITLVIALPVLGLCLYLIFGETRFLRHEKKMFKKLNQKNAKFSKTKNLQLPDFQGQSDYLFNSLNHPAFDNTQTKYFNSGETFFKAMLDDVKNAKHFILLEFYIINSGKMWNQLLELCIAKAKQGVEVKLLYDDIGTINNLSSRKPKQLQKLGIDCKIFNKYNFLTTIAHNNRDHRKIIVVDGKIAYTGGINISDEYININKSYYWKDSAIRLEGEAVKSFTKSFLNMFEISGGIIEGYEKYLEVQTTHVKDGYVQPFATGPLPFYSDTHTINILLNLINQARKKIYISTPYFVPDYQIMNALLIAHKRGVDVRIIIPGVPDKKIVYLITRANCAELVKQGIKVTRYKDAFVHAKSLLVDDEVGIIGSINFDFRSFVHNFECGVWQYKTNALQQLKKDYEEMFAEHGYIEVKDLKINFFERTIANILKVLYSIF